MSFEGYVRANTEVIVTIGPFPDVGDGFTPQTDIALSCDEAELIKHGSTSVVDISGATWAAVTNCRGYFSLTLTEALTDTEGMVTVIVQDDSDCLPVRNSFMVMSEAAWDSNFVAKDAGFMDVNIKTVGRVDTQETEANNLEAACAAYSVTRGLTGTALPAAASNAAGGLPISTAGALAMDTLADWVNGGRLDLILDIIAAHTTTIKAATDLISAVSACGDGDSPVADSLAEVLRQAKWFVANKWDVDENQTPDTLTMFKDDGVAAGLSFQVYADSSHNYRLPV